MKNNLTKRSLCIALVAVMLLGLSVINASACSHSSDYWELENTTYDYYELDSNYHDVCKSDIANCKLCGDIFTYCTHWYCESHTLTGKFESCYLNEYGQNVCLWRMTCTYCGCSFLLLEI
jgi:hypothetical protein